MFAPWYNGKDSYCFGSYLRKFHEGWRPLLL